MAERNGLCGNKQIVATDRSAGLFESIANLIIDRIGRRFKGQDVKRA
jgi:hypothetical protein